MEPIAGTDIISCVKFPHAAIVLCNPSWKGTLLRAGSFIIRTILAVNYLLRIQLFLIYSHLKGHISLYNSCIDFLFEESFQT